MKCLTAKKWWCDCATWNSQVDIIEKKPSSIIIALPALQPSSSPWLSLTFFAPEAIFQEGEKIKEHKNKGPEEHAKGKNLVCFIQTEYKLGLVGLSNVSNARRKEERMKEKESARFSPDFFVKSHVKVRKKKVMYTWCRHVGVAHLSWLRIVINEPPCTDTGARIKSIFPHSCNTFLLASECMIRTVVRRSLEMQISHFLRQESLCISVNFRYFVFGKNFCRAHRGWRGKWQLETWLNNVFSPTLASFLPRSLKSHSSVRRLELDRIRRNLLSALIHFGPGEVDGWMEAPPPLSHREAHITCGQTEQQPQSAKKERSGPDEDCACCCLTSFIHNREQS